MKKIILTTIVAVLGTVTTLLAQPANYYNYQGVLRSDDGAVMQNEDLDIIASYMNGEGNPVVYSESFTTTTNEFGEFNISLFDGILESGNDGNVNFLDEEIYINIEINDTDMGDIPIGLIPYAKSADFARLSQIALSADYALDAGNISATTSDPAPNTIYANSGPIAYGHIAGAVFRTEYGATSVTSPSTGVYEITCDNSWVGFPVVVVTAYNNTSDTEICTYQPVQDGNQITIRIVDEDNNPADSDVSFVIYGIAQ